MICALIIRGFTPASSHTFADSKGSTTWHDASKICLQSLSLSLSRLVCSTESYICLRPHASRVSAGYVISLFLMITQPSLPSCDNWDKQTCLTIHVLTTQLQNLQTTTVHPSDESAGPTVCRWLFCWTLWRWRCNALSSCSPWKLFLGIW